MSILDGQFISKSITSQKYLAKDETSIDDIKRRLAREFNTIDKEIFREDSSWEDEDKDIFDRFTPAGRIVANLGNKDVRRNCLVNCTSIPKIEDSLDGILDSFKITSKLLQAGAGVGTNFSTLRPRNFPVKGVNGKSSGPISFMEVGDSLAKTILSAGGRRGAQIGILDVSHPDIMDFITCKREGDLSQYNISVGISKGFIEAVKNDEDWELKFPVDSKDKKDVVKVLKAKEIWEAILRNSYEYAEPGTLFFDNANKFNTLHKSEDICSANP